MTDSSPSKNGLADRLEDAGGRRLTHDFFSPLCREAKAEIDRLRMAERLNVETVANFQKRIDELERELDLRRKGFRPAREAVAEWRAGQPPNAALRRYKFTKSGMFHNDQGEWVAWDQVRAASLPPEVDEAMESLIASYAAAWMRGAEASWVAGNVNTKHLATVLKFMQTLRDTVTKQERRFTGVGELERTGYIPAGSATEREGWDANGAPVETPAPLVPKGHFWRGKGDRDRCQNCGRSYFAHTRDDDGNWCPVSEGESR